MSKAMPKVAPRAIGPVRPGLRRLVVGGAASAASVAALASLSTAPPAAYARDAPGPGDRLTVTVRDAGGGADGTYEVRCRPDPAGACAAVERNTRGAERLRPGAAGRRPHPAVRRARHRPRHRHLGRPSRRRDPHPYERMRERPPGPAGAAAARSARRGARVRVTGSGGGGARWRVGAQGA